MNPSCVGLVSFILVAVVNAPVDAQIFRRGSRVTCGPNGCFMTSAPPGGVFATQAIGDPEDTGKPATGSLPPWQLNGVAADKIGFKGADAYTCSGQACTKFEAFGAALDDDSGKLWLVVCGEGRDSFLTDLRAKPELGNLLARTRVWSVPAGHFSLKDKGFPAGTPGIYFALADGTELYSAAAYSGPSTLDAIRVADPLYKPTPPIPPPGPPPIVPPLPSPLLPNVPALPTQPMALVLLVGVFFAFLILLPRR